MMEREKLVDLLGEQSVSYDPETLKKYSQDHSLAPSREPSCIVRPGSLEQVQDIIRLAGETNTPLIPVSSGEPHFHGDTVPVLGGVIMDMSGMNKIRMIDRKDRVAMVEPGVRFTDLQAELKKEGLRLPMPLCPRVTKSVAGSCLEREPHIIPKYHLDHSDPLLCNEVVFGTGDTFRTGEAAGPGTLEEQQQSGRRQKISMGIQMNINRILQGAQGTLGVVTWSTVKCELLPLLQKPFLVPSDDLQRLLELAHWLVRLRLGDELFILNWNNLAALVGRSNDEPNAIMKDYPEWTLFFCLSGGEFFPEDRVKQQEKDISIIAKNLGIPLYETFCNLSAKEVLKLVSSPSPEPYWKLRPRGGCQDIPFITSFHKVPEMVDVIKQEVLKRNFPLSSLGLYIQPVCQGHGHHCEFCLFYDPSSPEQRGKIKDLYLSAGKALMDKGAFFSRPYDILTESVYNRDGASRDALRKIKRIFDPNNILNPGKLCF